MGAVTMHSSKCLHDALGEIGGVSLCFPLVAQPPPDQCKALKILRAILARSRACVKDFQTRDGFLVLTSLLSATPLTRSTFDILLQIAALPGLAVGGKGVVKAPAAATGEALLLQSEDAVVLVFDLLRNGAYRDELAKQALRTLSDTLIAMPANGRLLRESPSLGLIVSLDSLISMNSDYRHYLMRWLRHTAKHFSADELLLLIQFVLVDRHNEIVAETKADVLELLLHQIWKHAGLFKHFSGLPECWDLVFSLFDTPLERIRISACKLTGILLTSREPRMRDRFFRKLGFSTIGNLLAPYPISANTCSALLGLALDLFRAAPDVPTTAAPSSKQKDGSSLASAPETQGRRGAGPGKRLGAATSRVIVHHDAIRILLQLLENCSDEALHLQVLFDLQRLLRDRKNKNAFWDSDWLYWFSRYCRLRSNGHAPHRLLTPARNG